jgi:hypothetical protein
MPLYYFNLKDSRGALIDPDGAEFPDDDAALAYGREVADELMLGREVQTRSWRLIVCDGERRPRFELLFASLDRSLNHLAPEMRANVERYYGNQAQLADAICNIHQTINQVRGTIAQSENKPYLAAINGVALIDTPRAPAVRDPIA